MFQPIASLGVALLAATTVLAADPVSCGLDKKCPKETPCCSRETPLLSPMSRHKTMQIEMAMVAQTCSSSCQ